MVDPPLRIVCEQSEEDVERKRTRYEIGFVLHEMAANLLRIARALIGHHHHIAGQYLLRYAQEAPWREDNRRQANGDHVNRVAKLAPGQQTVREFQRVLVAARFRLIRPRSAAQNYSK